MYPLSTQVLVFGAFAFGHLVQIREHPEIHQAFPRVVERRPRYYYNVDFSYQTELWTEKYGAE